MKLPVVNAKETAYTSKFIVADLLNSKMICHLAQ